MNYWKAQDTTVQEFTVTPRDYGLSCDSTFVTADEARITADRTNPEYSGTYTMEFVKDGSNTKQNSSVYGAQKGRDLVISTSESFDQDSFYYFKLFVSGPNGPDIYRGKAFTYEMLPDTPLHYSIYENSGLI